MSKIEIPGVRKKRSKGHTYYYWAKADPWVRLPDPTKQPDEFMRKIAHLKRVHEAKSEKSKTGTFGGLVAAYRQSEKYLKRADNTRRVYDRYLSRLLKRYADAPLSEITPEDIQVHVLDPNEDTPGAANMMLVVLRNLYKFASKRHRHLEDWTAGREKFEADPDNEREPWPEEVLEAALSCEDELFRRAVTLALYTGQRPGDVCDMTWGKVKGDHIEVKQEKTSTHLLIPMHRDLKVMLSGIERSNRHLFILSNRHGGRLTSASFRKWCKEFTAQYGFNGLPHGLRKNAVNALFEGGSTAAQVASVTGHKSLRMVEHYGKKRNQPKLARAAMSNWETKNRKGTGKPSG